MKKVKNGKLDLAQKIFFVGFGTLGHRIGRPQNRFLSIYPGNSPFSWKFSFFQKFPKYQEISTGGGAGWRKIR